jgi:ornithine carbamoyltransferase
MWQRFTERARRVVFFAQEEAARYGENYVATEHLLLGLVRESDSVAGRILERLDVPLGRLRVEIEMQVTRGHGKLGQDMQLTPRAKKVIDLAYEEARELNNNYIGTEHLLLGLVREGDGLAARVLVKQGADYERTKKAVQEMQEAGGPMTPEESPEAMALLEPAAALNLVRRYTAELVENPTRALRAVRCVSAARRACSGLDDLIAIADLNATQAEALLQLAWALKLAGSVGPHGLDTILSRKSLALIFEKPSLRTRVTFEAGMFQLGGQAMHLAAGDIGLGQREPVADVARNLERWVDGIAARTFRHQTVVDLAAHAKVPVINALSDHEHPCQALADMLTLLEHHMKLEGLQLAYVGDGNNVANSLALLAAKLGVNLALACPAGYEPAGEVIAAAQAEAEQRGSWIRVARDPREAVRGADAVYTDVWTSMGQESEAEERARIFRPYQLNAELMALAKPEALVMHCLPAHRGEEITDEVMDGPQSVVFDQAENRLHAQKAVLAVLL